MRAKNIHKTAFNLESGVCAPGDTAEFTDKEFKFLSGIKRAEVAKAKPAPSYKKKES